MTNGTKNLNDQIANDNIPRLAEHKLVTFKDTSNYKNLKEFKVECFKQCLFSELQLDPKHLNIF